MLLRDELAEDLGTILASGDEIPLTGQLEARCDVGGAIGRGGRCDAQTGIRSRRADGRTAARSNLADDRVARKIPRTRYRTQAV